MSRPALWEQIFTLQMQTLAAVLQPSTVRYYQSIVNRFLRYLHTTFWLLRHADGRRISYADMRAALQEAARRAGCTETVRLHRLRHTFASEMLRAGASLPAVKEMLGHKNIRMTMVYIQITQNDLQREYHQARQKLAHLHTLPLVPAAATAEIVTSATLPAISRSLAATRHLLEMYRRQLGDEPTRRQIGRLLNRLTKIAAQLINAEK